MTTRKAYNDFIFDYDTDTGSAYSIYAYGMTGCLPVPDDQFHADLLGITNKQHRLVHEICHHVIGWVFYKSTSSPVLQRDVNGHKQNEASQEEEWLVTALTYELFNKYWAHRQSGIKKLKSAGVDIAATIAQLKGELTYFDNSLKF